MAKAAERTVCFKVDNLEKIQSKTAEDIHSKLDHAFVDAGAFPRHTDVEKQICCVDIYDSKVQPEAIQAVLEKFGLHAELMETNPPLRRKFSIRFTTAQAVITIIIIIVLIAYLIFYTIKNLIL